MRCAGSRAVNDIAIISEHDSVVGTVIHVANRVSIGSTFDPGPFSRTISIADIGTDAGTDNGCAVD